MTDIDEQTIKDVIASKTATADQLKSMLDEVRAAHREKLATLKEISNTDGVPGKRRAEVLESGSVEDLKTLNAEVEIEQARLERLHRYQTQLKRLHNARSAKESAERLPEYRKELAKAAKKVSKANKALAEAWGECDTALRSLKTAHGHAVSIHAEIQPASDSVTEAVQDAWQCAHTRDMAGWFHSNRGQVADLLGHRAKNVSKIPAESKTVFT